MESDPTTATAAASSGEHGYAVRKRAISARLRRIEGQVRGVERMVADDRYCIDVLTQISAIRAALDKVALGLVEDHVRHCMLGGEHGSGDATSEERVEELVAALRRFV